ncbi:MAG: hypothetical protein ACXWL5_00645 [Candidatus Chromulinivorax sp.]
MIKHYFYSILLLSMQLIIASDDRMDIEQLIKHSLQEKQFKEYNWQRAAQKAFYMPMTIGLELYENKSFVGLVDVITFYTKNKDQSLKSIFTEKEINALYQSQLLPEHKMMHSILAITVQKIAEKKGP